MRSTTSRIQSSRAPRAVAIASLLMIVALTAIPASGQSDGTPASAPANEACNIRRAQGIQSFATPGGGARFQVLTDSGCSYTVTVDADWILLEEPGERRGSRPVVYRVRKADGALRRRGTIRIGDRNHHVLQEGTRKRRAPRSPTDLKIEPRRVDKMRVSWKAKGQNRTGHAVQRDNIIWLLSRNRRTLDDVEIASGERTCYKVIAYNDLARSGPSKGCAQSLAGGGAASDEDLAPAPAYVTEPATLVQVDPWVGELPALPRVRVYKNYEPWRDRSVELLLEHLGYLHGESLFVHPVADLAGGIPAATDIVVIPSASAGNLKDQVRSFNGRAAQRELRRFVQRGGTLVLHRYSSVGALYALPVKGAADFARHGYEGFERGGGVLFVTDDPVDHPIAGPLRANLYRLFDEILAGS